MNQTRDPIAMSILMAIAFLLMLPASTSALGSDGIAKPGRLTFDPAKPAAGQPVEVTYVPGDQLAGVERLHLRARVRTPFDDSYNDGIGSRHVAILERKADGSFAGSFVLPERAVYAAFAVEDEAAAQVDSRQGDFWEILIHAGEKPLFEALEQRLYDHMGRDRMEVLRTAREMVRHYPELVATWNMLRFAEGLVLAEEEIEVRLSVHRERLQSFDAELQDTVLLPADQVGYMYWYARALAERDVSEAWRARLLEEHPGHFFAVQERYVTLRREMGDDLVGVLEELERLWDIADSHEARSRIAVWALSVSRTLGDREDILPWAERSVEFGERTPASIAVMLTNLEATREDGMPRLREAIARAERAPDDDRPLGATSEYHRTNSGRRAAHYRTILAEKLLKGENGQEAVATLEVVSNESRMANRFFAVLGDAYLSTGSVEAAMNAYAAVAADPATSASQADSLRQLVGASEQEWEHSILVATDDMRARILRSARDESLPDVRVSLLDRSTAPLARYFGNDASVVVFWSRYCGPSNAAMPRIEELSEELAADGIPFLAVTEDEPEEAEPFLNENEWDLTVLYDTAAEAAGAFNSWGTPQYFVVDGSGHLRFAHSSLATLPREIDALLNGRR